MEPPDKAFILQELEDERHLVLSKAEVPAGEWPGLTRFVEERDGRRPEARGIHRMSVRKSTECL